MRTPLLSAVRRQRLLHYACVSAVCRQCLLRSSCFGGVPPSSVCSVLRASVLSAVSEICSVSPCVSHCRQPSVPARSSCLSAVHCQRLLHYSCLVALLLAGSWEGSLLLLPHDACARVRTTRVQKYGGFVVAFCGGLVVSWLWHLSCHSRGTRCFGVDRQGFFLRKMLQPDRGFYKRRGIMVAYVAELWRVCRSNPSTCGGGIYTTVPQCSATAVIQLRCIRCPDELDRLSEGWRAGGRSAGGGCPAVAGADWGPDSELRAPWLVVRKAPRASLASWLTSFWRSSCRSLCHGRFLPSTTAPTEEGCCLDICCLDTSAVVTSPLALRVFATDSVRFWPF